MITKADNDNIKDGLKPLFDEMAGKDPHILSQLLSIYNVAKSRDQGDYIFIFLDYGSTKNHLPYMAYRERPTTETVIKSGDIFQQYPNINNPELIAVLDTKIDFDAQIQNWPFPKEQMDNWRALINHPLIAPFRQLTDKNPKPLRIAGPKYGSLTIVG